MKLLAFLGTAVIALATCTTAAPKDPARDLASIIAGAGPGQILLRKPVPGFLHPQAEALFFLPETSEASDENPVEVHGAILRKGEAPVLLARFPYEGGVAGIVDAVLLPTASGFSKNLGVIARWRVKHRGLGIDGEMYKVYVFKDRLRQAGGQPMAEAHDSLMKVFGEGFEGMQEGGTPSAFKFKTSADLLAQSAALTVPAAMKRLKASRNPEEWSRVLADIGISRDSLPYLSPVLEAGKKPVRILRAEVFLEDLEGDGQKEGVGQVVFEWGRSGEPDSLDYVFMIHSDPLGRPGLRYMRSFKFLTCGRPSKAGMRFAFKRSPQSGKSRVVLQMSRIPSCSGASTTLDSQVDILSIFNGTYKYPPDTRNKK